MVLLVESDHLLGFGYVVDWKVEQKPCNWSYAAENGYPQQKKTFRIQYPTWVTTDQSSFVNCLERGYKRRMAMRYIYRRQNPENWGDLKSSITNLENQLGRPLENSRRYIKVAESDQPLEYTQYTFLGRKTSSGNIWVCTSVELVAENEKGLFHLTAKHNIPKPAHLAHLPA